MFDGFAHFAADGPQAALLGLVFGGEDFASPELFCQRAKAGGFGQQRGWVVAVELEQDHGLVTEQLRRQLHHRADGGEGPFFEQLTSGRVETMAKNRLDGAGRRLEFGEG